MAWTDILSSQVDADSPLNDILFAAIKADLDYLRSFAANVAEFEGYDANAVDTDPLTITVQAAGDRNWLDRDITVLFCLVNSGLEGVPDVYYKTGGAKDTSLHTQRAGHKTADQAGWNGSALFKAESFYSSAGSANYTTEPYLVSTSKEGTGITEAYIWVDTSGNLKLTIDFGGAPNNRGYAYRMKVLFSEDKGGH